MNGTHYARTAEHWLANMDANRAAPMPLLAQTYGDRQALKRWVYRACSTWPVPSFGNSGTARSGM